eukprot:gene20496-2232_t
MNASLFSSSSPVPNTTQFNAVRLSTAHSTLASGTVDAVDEAGRGFRQLTFMSNNNAGGTCSTETLFLRTYCSFLSKDKCKGACEWVQGTATTTSVTATTATTITATTKTTTSVTTVTVTSKTATSATTTTARLCPKDQYYRLATKKTPDACIECPNGSTLPRSNHQLRLCVCKAGYTGYPKCVSTTTATTVTATITTTTTTARLCPKNQYYRPATKKTPDACIECPKGSELLKSNHQVRLCVCKSGYTGYP